MVTPPTTCAFRRKPEKGQKNMQTRHNPKTLIVVPVVRIVPVTRGRARVVLIVVPRAAAHRPGLFPRPPDPLQGAQGHMLAAGTS
jgi:hypothetical protein